MKAKRVKYPEGYYCDKGQHDVESVSDFGKGKRYEDDGCYHTEACKKCEKK